MRLVVSAGTLAVVPARRPTRGSGLGAAADMVMFSAGAGAAALDEALDGAARAASSVRAQHLFPRSLLSKWGLGGAPLENQA